MASRLLVTLLAFLLLACGDHRGGRSAPPAAVYGFSLGLNEFMVPADASPAEIASAQLAAWWWIDRNLPAGQPTGFRWAWWHAGGTSVSGNRVDGYLVHVHRGQLLNDAPAHANVGDWSLELGGPRPVIHLWAGLRWTLPGFGRALLHAEGGWDSGGFDWHHQSATSGGGWPLGWTEGWAWAARAEPPW